MSRPILSFRFSTMARLAAFALVLLCAVRYGAAQDTTPLLSGGIGFFTRTNGGNTTYFPYIKPVAALPLGGHVLIETRGSIAEFFSPTPRGYKTSSFKTVDYLQGDFMVAPHLTIVGGEFLTPFGTYNERQTQIWLQTFQDFPLIYGIGTMNTGASVGGMARGSAYSNEHVNVTYAAYYGSNITNQYFAAERSTGGQAAVYVPEYGLEVGASYGRSLGVAHENFWGTDVWWEPIGSPFRFRSEYAHAPHSQGYWFETDYRLSHFGGPDSPIGRLEPVFRMEQTFRDKPDPNDGAPSVNTQRANFGLDYHLPHEVRINTSYARQFAPNAGGGNVNIWETAIIYRFLFPAWKSKK
jgi:hypothetical protein